MIVGEPADPVLGRELGLRRSRLREAQVVEPQIGGDLRLMASPSTCVQFAVGSSDFATDNLAPGYRWLRLYDDGRLESEIARLPAGSFMPQAGAAGY